jgi:hypothetical protein
MSRRRGPFRWYRDPSRLVRFPPHYGHAGPSDRFRPKADVGQSSARSHFRAPASANNQTLLMTLSTAVRQYAVFTRRRRGLMRRGISSVAIACLAGCSQSPEQIVTSTSHCTEVRVTPDLMIRLSSYAGYPDSIRLWVVQACHVTGTACDPILTYSHAPPPKYEVRRGTLTISLLGGGEPRVHQDRVKFGSTNYQVAVRHLRGRPSQHDLDSFIRRPLHQCPPGSRPYPV